jgi:hypothetical protein
LDFAKLHLHLTIFNQIVTLNFTVMPQYRGNEGELIPVKQVRVYTCAHVDHESPGHDHHFIEAEFFGLKKFKQLLKECGGKPVGFRVYYGIRHEDHSKGEPCECSIEEGGKATPRLFIVPVDAHGTELTGINSIRGTKKKETKSGSTDKSSGLKDMPEDDGNAMGGGPVCPTFC